MLRNLKRSSRGGQYDLLAEAVEHLLSTRNGWQMIRIPDEGDEATLLREVASLFYDNSTLFLTF